MKEPGILLYNLANEKGSKIEKLCKRQQIEVKHVLPTEYRKPIGFLADMFNNAEAEPTEATTFSDEMLVMVGFPENLLNTFLKECKARHIERINLKAVITEHNKMWSSIQLLEELTKERDYYEGTQN